VLRLRCKAIYRVPSFHNIQLPVMRSKLFVPGSRPELFPKALASGADALSFDLEDSVAMNRKAEARQAVSTFLRERAADQCQTMLVRVNGLASGLFAADVTALAGCGVDMINVPKVESTDDVRQALDVIPGDIKILANIETPKGLRLAVQIATADARIAGLQLGFIDLFSRCGIDSRETAAKYSIRLAVRLAAAEAGIAVFDSAFAGVKDLEGFRAEAEAARSLGFSGKSCIHPTQVAIANQVFAPSRDEIARAEEILQAMRQRGQDVFLLDGQMIDKPILERARAVVRLAESLKARAE
jgi:citrate lyase subunit beta/citryl-CoA lyase